MRTTCYQHYSHGDLRNSIIAVVVIMFSCNLFALSQSSPLTDEGELLTIYREMKLCESESLRVAVTIDALEAELHEDPNTENREQIHVQLGRLYKYDVLLAAHYIDLNELWTYLQDTGRESTPTSFDASQSKPITKIRESIYEGIADDTIPVTGFSPIDVKDF